MCGYFKGGFINGIGRINFENGNIYEGLMKKMSLYSGKLQFEFLLKMFKVFLMFLKPIHMSLEISKMENAIKYMKEVKVFLLHC